MTGTAGRARRVFVQDAFVPAAAVVAVLMLVIPIPATVLDVFLILNIAFAITVLVSTMFVKQVLELSVFPSLLLLTTLFRLALEVTATRLILLDGSAGAVIQTFGQFVVGNNLVVGLIIFLILVVIQFVVITRGAERVSEVAARFTLDAMPGKQMAIDAELNAGLIHEEEAKQRRRDIEREADFYGAMDGASKFVRGDAVAGILIVIVNIIGGLIVGLVQRGLPIGTALSTYTILTVGEALTTQIPALLLSTAAGMIVTRVAGQESLGGELWQQLTAMPRVLYITAIAMVALAVLGLPTLPLLALGAAAWVAAWQMERRQQAARADAARAAEEARAADQRRPESALSYIGVDTVELEVGMGLVPLVGTGEGVDIKERVHALRRQLAAELGLILSPVRIRDNLELEMNRYRIRVRGAEVAAGEVLPHYYLAMGPGKLPVDGIETEDPVFGVPAMWIRADARERAEMAGATVIDAASVVVTHLAEVLRRHAAEVLSRQDVQTLLDHVKTTQSAVVQELVPDLLSLGEVQRVLTNLLRERVSIRDLPTILEALADRARSTRDPDLLTESARQALGRAICRPLAPNGVLEGLVLAPAAETAIRDAVEHTDAGSYLNLDPTVAQKLLASLSTELSRLRPGQPPVVLASPLVRLYFKRLTERAVRDLAVLSYAELSPEISVKTVGVVNL
jgi:flagellar biosynthesis protein FlhA